MTKHDLKAVYAKNNRDWRIVYMPGGTWKLQQYTPIGASQDRSRLQPWKDHNANMTFDDAIVLLSGRDKAKAA